MTTPVERLIRSYLDHLAVERGASPHTRAGYSRDLRRYAAFLIGRGVTDPASVSETDVSAFVAELQTAGETSTALSAASAGRALAAVRSLHAFAVRDGLAADDPAAGVRPPKAVRRLPKALSVDQVTTLLQTPDQTTPTGLRDAALLELLYGTGARISEVTALDVDEVASLVEQPQAGLRLFGKGRKERIVPVGSYAVAAVSGVAGARSFAVRPGVLAAQPGAAAERARPTAQPAERLADPAEDGHCGPPRRGRFAAHAAALVRHSSARRRSRRPGGAGVARSRLCDHHPDLHVGNGRASA